MLRPRIFWHSIGLIFLASIDSRAADFDQGPKLAALCASCHRLDARGTPFIIGLDPAKFVALMQAYRDSEHPNIIMYAVARSLSDQELGTLGAYLSQLGKETKSP